MSGVYVDASWVGDDTPGKLVYPLTRCAWIKPITYTTDNFSMVCHGLYRLVMDSAAGQLMWYEPAATNVTGYNMSINTWYFVALTTDQNSQKVYASPAGSALVQRGANFTKNLTGVTAANIRPLWNDIQVGTGCQGVVWESRYWDAILTLAELQAEMSSLGGPIRTANLFSDYRFTRDQRYRFDDLGPLGFHLRESGSLPLVTPWDGDLPLVVAAPPTGFELTL